jgi:cysteinyl-tRNA synthetase
LYDLVLASKRQTERSVLSEEKQKKVDDFNTRFVESINDDLNTAKALAVLWEVMKSNIPSEDKYDLALSFDEVLGLGLSTIPEQTNEEFEVPEDVQTLLQERYEARKNNDFAKSDELRKEINAKGFEVLDTKDGQEVKKKFA